MALEFQGLTRPRGTAPAALFDPQAYVTDPAPAPSSGPAESEVCIPTQTKVADRPSPAATPIRIRRPRQLAAVGVVALAAAGWATSMLLTASPTTGPAPVAASGASALRSPVLEFPLPPVVQSSARSEDLTGSVPAAPSSKAVADNAPPAATVTPDIHNTQSVKRVISPRKPPAAVAAPPRAQAEQWAAAFGPNSPFWTHFRSVEHHWQR